MTGWRKQWARFVVFCTRFVAAAPRQVFIATTLAIVVVMWRRQFDSDAYRAMSK